MAGFTSDSIMGQIWKNYWIEKDLRSKEPEEIQKEYVAFCRRYRINAPCWETIGPYVDGRHLETRCTVAFNAHVTNLKALSYSAIFDWHEPMSGRVGSVFLYAVIRLAEIIDWWFPVKVKTP
jgi:hypothetical protein